MCCRAARRAALHLGAMFGDNGHGALGGRVLVVEDDADLREVMAGALTADGHVVVEAADGRAALDALAAQTFDLVLLDVGLGPRARRRRGLPAPARRRRGRARGRRDRPRRRGRRGARARGRRRRLRDQAGRDRRAAQPRARRAAARAPQRRAARGRCATARCALDADARARRARRRRAAASPTPSSRSSTRCCAPTGGCSRARSCSTPIFGGHEFRDPRAIDVHVHFLRDKLAAAGGDPERIVTVRGAGYRLRA